MKEINTKTRKIEPNQHYRISGDADEIIWDSDYHIRVDSPVIIIDYPDDTGYALANVCYIDGDFDVQLYVKVSALLDP